MRIVFRTLAQRIEIGAGEAGVEASGGEVFIFLEGFFELAAIDAEVGAEQVLDWQSDVLVKLLGDSLFLFRAEVRTLGECVGVWAGGEGFYIR